MLNCHTVASGVNLLESGTQGYKGQTTTIAHGVKQEEYKTECFECQPPPPEKQTFAVCTIRNTPDKPHHCCVWSEMIFSAFFGPDDEDNYLNDMKLNIGSQSPQDFAETLFEA